MYRSILIPLDGSALAERALDVAVGLAERLGAELRLVHVHRPVVVDELARYGVRGAAAVATAEHYLAASVDRLRHTSGLSVSGSVIEGAPAPSIVAHAQATASDLIVMASHGRTGASRFWLGSVADAVLRSANIPVLMVRDRPETPDSGPGPLFERVLLPLDGSALAEEVLPHAMAIARLGPAHAHLLRVEEPAEDVQRSVWAIAAERDRDDLPERLDAAHRYLHSVVERFGREWAPVTTSVEARAGRRVGETISAVATERACDLIAMTTHGRGASRLLIGSVADKVIRGTTCSILLYRARPPR